jgi:hypothetical protein
LQTATSDLQLVNAMMNIVPVYLKSYPAPILLRHRIGAGKPA